jgi:hypothetical protein
MAEAGFIFYFGLWLTFHKLVKDYLNLLKQKVLQTTLFC